MKIIVCSTGHEPRMRAHRWLESHDDVTYVCDTDEQAARIRSITGRLAVPAHPTSDVPKQSRVAFARQFAEDNLINDGEWYATVDDNVEKITYLGGADEKNDSFYLFYDRLDFDEHWKHDFRQLFEHTAPLAVLKDLVWPDSIREAEKIGSPMVGFATETNFFFRKIKWQHHGYVRCQHALIKKVPDLRWFYWCENMLEDFTRSVDCVAKYGKVLINRYAKAVKPFFEEGGIGSFDERLPNLVAVNQELMRRYPGLLKSNKGQDYQLTFALRSQRTIDEWRQFNGYTKA